MIPTPGSTVVHVAGEASVTDSSLVCLLYRTCSESRTDNIDVANDTKFDDPEAVVLISTKQHEYPIMRSCSHR